MKNHFVCGFYTERKHKTVGCTAAGALPTCEVRARRFFCDCVRVLRSALQSKASLRATSNKRTSMVINGPHKTFYTVQPFVLCNLNWTLNSWHLFTHLLYTKHLKQDSVKKYRRQQDYLSINEMSYSRPRKRDDIKRGW